MTECLSRVDQAMRNTVKYGNYWPDMDVEEFKQLLENPNYCMRSEGVDSDFMLVASLILQEVSLRYVDNKGHRMCHLGLIMLNLEEDEKGQASAQALVDMIQNTLPMQAGINAINTINTIYTLNVHLSYPSINFYHEASVVFDVSNRTLEYWDASRPQVFSAFYRALRQLKVATINRVILVPDRKVQVRPASCGFWALWYFQRRMQGCSGETINRWFFKKAQSAQIRKELAPRMQLLAAAVLKCWPSEQRRLALNAIQTDQEHVNLERLAQIICRCVQLDVVSQIPAQWQDLCRIHPDWSSSIDPVSKRPFKKQKLNLR